MHLHYILQLQITSPWIRITSSLSGIHTYGLGSNTESPDHIPMDYHHILIFQMTSLRFSVWGCDLCTFESHPETVHDIPVDVDQDVTQMHGDVICRLRMWSKSMEMWYTKWGCTLNAEEFVMQTEDVIQIAWGCHVQSEEMIQIHWDVIQRVGMRSRDWCDWHLLGCDLKAEGMIPMEKDVICTLRMWSRWLGMWSKCMSMWFTESGSDPNAQKCDLQI